MFIILVSFPTCTVGLQAKLSDRALTAVPEKKFTTGFDLNSNFMVKKGKHLGSKSDVDFYEGDMIQHDTQKHSHVMMKYIHKSQDYDEEKEACKISQKAFHAAEKLELNHLQDKVSRCFGWKMLTKFIKKEFVSIWEIPGDTRLSTLIKESADDTRSVFEDVLDGLTLLQAIGVNHRDIKPANIMVKRDNGKLRAKLIGFSFSTVPEMTRECDNEVFERGKLTEPCLKGLSYSQIYHPYEFYSHNAPYKYYICPEKENGRTCTHSFDIYSLGMTIIDLLGIGPLNDKTDTLTTLMKCDTKKLFDKTLDTFDDRTVRMMDKIDAATDGRCFVKSWPKWAWSSKENLAIIRTALTSIASNASKRPTPFEAKRMLLQGKSNQIKEHGGREKSMDESECKEHTVSVTKECYSEGICKVCLAGKLRSVSLPLYDYFRRGPAPALNERDKDRAVDIKELLYKPLSDYPQKLIPLEKVSFDSSVDRRIWFFEIALKMVIALKTAYFGGQIVSHIAPRHVQVVSSHLKPSNYKIVFSKSVKTHDLATNYFCDGKSAIPCDLQNRDEYDSMFMAPEFNLKHGKTVVPYCDVSVSDACGSASTVYEIGMTLLTSLRKNKTKIDSKELQRIKDIFLQHPIAALNPEGKVSFWGRLSEDQAKTKAFLDIFPSWTLTSAAFMNLLKSMIDSSPEKRPTWDIIVSKLFEELDKIKKNWNQTITNQNIHIRHWKKFFVNCSVDKKKSYPNLNKCLESRHSECLVCERADVIKVTPSVVSLMIYGLPTKNSSEKDPANFIDFEILRSMF